MDPDPTFTHEVSIVAAFCTTALSKAPAAPPFVSTPFTSDPVSKEYSIASSEGVYEPAGQVSTVEEAPTEAYVPRKDKLTICERNAVVFIAYLIHRHHM